MKHAPQETSPNKRERLQTEALDEVDAGKKKKHTWILLLVFLPCFLITLHLDNDIWFLLNSGRYVLQHGIPTIEPFTLHQNFHFLMQQWLSAAIFWGIYSKLGAAGVIALVFVLYCAIVAVITRLSWHISGGNLIATFLAGLLSSAALKMVMVSRPMAFTLLILVSELYLLERFISTTKPAFLIPLPILSALLVNLHAAMWPIQFVLLLPYLIDAFRFKFLTIQGQGYPKRYFFPSVALMFGAGFLNPYGWSAMSYVFRSYGYKEIAIVQEMQPADINTVTGMMIFGAMFLVLAFYLLKKERTTRLRFALLSFGTALLALSSMRSFALFAICGFFPLAYLLRNATVPEGKLSSGKSALKLRVVLIVLVAAVVGGTITQRLLAFDSKKELPTVSTAVDYLNAHEQAETMQLYTGYNDGGYVEFMGFKPYIDPRAEVFVEKNNKAEDVMKEYYLLQSGQTYYKTVLDKYRFTHLLVSHEDILFANLPHDADYQLIYEDSEYAIYRNRG